jgi:hypothetical protein
MFGIVRLMRGKANTEKPLLICRRITFLVLSQPCARS